MIHHPSIEISGVGYDLDHLVSFILNVDSERAQKQLTVRVSFTNHCYTVQHDPAAHPEGWPILRDGGGRARTFCPERYRLSKQMLPAFIQQLNHPKAAVRQTHERRNWVHSALIDTEIGTYVAFFELRRSRATSVDLEMVVESAYARLEPAGTLGRIGFILLCGRVFRGDPVATRR